MSGYERLTRIATAAALSAAACCQLLHAAQGPAVAPAADAKLVITGSGTMAPLVSEMVQRFEALYPGVKIEVRSGGSGKGINERN